MFSGSVELSLVASEVVPGAVSDDVIPVALVLPETVTVSVYVDSTVVVDTTSLPVPDVSPQPYGLVQEGPVVLSLADAVVPGSADESVIPVVDAFSVLVGPV